jgi:hypothetical protein
MKFAAEELWKGFEVGSRKVLETSIFRLRTPEKKICVKSGSLALKVNTCLPAKAGFQLTNEANE